MSFLPGDGLQKAATEKVLSTLIHSGSQESSSNLHFGLMLGKVLRTKPAGSVD